MPDPAAVRTNFASRCDFGPYRDFYLPHLAGEAFPDHVSMTTNLMVHSDYRSGTLGVR